MDRVPEDGDVRLDKWLWAARLLKTRGLAAEAVRGGRVHVDGERAKPSRAVRIGDRVELTKGEGLRIEVVVRGVSGRRGPAAVAAQLYEETPESRAARERHAAERRFAAPPAPVAGGRPTKRDRRRLERGPGARRGRG